MTTDEPTKSANGTYSYEDMYCYITLDKWVEMTHRDLSMKSGWTYYPLKKGAFGYDNLVVSIGHMFDEFNKFNEHHLDKSHPPPITQEMMANWIHEGWTINYLYWRDNKPWLKKHQKINGCVYRAPAKSLADERRDACAATQFADLDDEEREKDLIIARFIMNKMEAI